jgi:Ca2+-binding RTX toxin-like protein
MAISSVGGQEPTETTGNAIATPGGSLVPPSGSASMGGDQSGETPYATVGDKTFANQDEFTKWWNDQRSGESTTEAASGNDTLQGNAGEDTLKGGQGNDAITESDDAIKARLKEAGGIYADDRYAPFALEFEKTGDLTADSVKKAAEAFNIPQDFVQEFINNAKVAKTAAQQSAGQPSPEQVRMATAIVEIVPDEAGYKAILEWGKDNLSAPEKTAYDSALNRGDVDTAKALLTGFQQRFNASGNGPGPRDVTKEGQGGDSGGTPGFASSAEMQAAMRDPKYANDPAYRRTVELRVAASKF